MIAADIIIGDENLLACNKDFSITKKLLKNLDVDLFPDDREDLVDPKRGKGRRNYSRKGTGHYKRSQANKRNA